MLWTDQNPSPLSFSHFYIGITGIIGIFHPPVESYPSQYISCLTFKGRYTTPFQTTCATSLSSWMCFCILVLSESWGWLCCGDRLEYAASQIYHLWYQSGGPSTFYFGTFYFILSHPQAQFAKPINALQPLRNMSPNLSENLERLIIVQLELIISLGAMCKCYCAQVALLPSQIFLRTSTPLPTLYRPKLGWAECEAAVVNFLTLTRMEYLPHCVLQTNKWLPMSS